MSKKFLRTSWRKKSRLGLGRRKKQKWRRARGRHNKIRESIRGKLRKVEIGFRTSKKLRFKIKGKIPVPVRNLRDVKKVARGELVILGKFGKKKRNEIVKLLDEKGAEILNRK